MKTVIVTGGSRGIGKCIVETLAKKGYNVVLNYNKSKAEAEKIQKELEGQKCNVKIFKADVSKEDEVKKLIEFAVEKYANIDVLINNAGIYKFNFIQDIKEEEWENIINSNLKSVFLCSREAITMMLKNKKGCIINISSIDGVSGAACEVHYVASKAGVDGITKALAKELRSFKYKS